MTELKPFFSFFGGKWRSAKRYPAPKHNTIIEPFAGSAGYSLRYADRNVILVERDPVVASVWQWLIDPATTPDVVRALPLVRDGERMSDPKFAALPPGARALIGFKLQQGSTRPGQSMSHWGMHADGTPKALIEYSPGQCWGAKHRERVATQVNAIKHWKIVCNTYANMVDSDVRATWFVDPPYAGPGCHYVYGSKNIDYAHLRAWCEARAGQVIVCEQQGAAWAPFEYFGAVKANPSSKRASDAGRHVSHEMLWAFDR